MLSKQSLNHFLHLRSKLVIIYALVDWLGTRYQRQLAHFSALIARAFSERDQLHLVACVTYVSACLYTLLPFSSCLSLLSSIWSNASIKKSEKWQCSTAMTTLISLSSVEWCMYGINGMPCHVHPFQSMSIIHHLDYYYYCSVLPVCLVIAVVVEWGTQQEVMTAEVIIAEEEAGTCRTRRSLSVRRPADLPYQLTVVSSQSASKHASKDWRREALASSISSSVYFWMEGSESENRAKMCLWLQL